MCSLSWCICFPGTAGTNVLAFCICSFWCWVLSQGNGLELYCYCAGYWHDRFCSEQYRTLLKNITERSAPVLDNWVAGCMGMFTFCRSWDFAWKKKCRWETGSGILFGLEGFLIFIKLFIYLLHDFECNSCLFSLGGVGGETKPTDGLKILSVWEKNYRRGI